MKNAAHLYVAGLAVVAAGLACQRADPEPQAVRDSSDIAPATVAAAEDTRPIILFVGTSLTAGFGLDPSQAYPALIQDRLDAAGWAYQVVNGGVSGQTSAGAASGLDWLLRRPAAVLIVETGANDGLRGIDTDELRTNIERILDRARQQTPPPDIILAGMEAPPNLGRAYTDAFRGVYRDLAQAPDVTLVPFLLDGVAGVDSLNQADGIHPTPVGQRILADHVWRVLEPILQERGG